MTQAYTLEKCSPEMLSTYNRLQTELDAIPKEELGSQQTRRQREPTTELEHVVTLIRQVPGLEGFLLPQKRESILEMACDGPIVIVNSSETLRSSHAVIIQSSGLDVVPLGRLQYSEIKKRMKNMETIVSSVWTLRTFAAQNQ